MIFGITFFMSCEKNKEIQEKLVNNDVGKYHNEILQKFYSNNKLKSTMSFDDKVREIDTYLSEVIDGVEVGIFQVIG